MKTSSRRQLIREAINLFSSCLWSGCLLLTYSCSELPPNVTLAQWSWWAQGEYRVNAWHLCSSFAIGKERKNVGKSSQKAWL